MGREQVGVGIVLIDDHPLSVRAIEALVSHAGHTVLGTADDAAKGVACVEDLRPRVAIVDLVLPDATGAEVIRRIRDIPDLRVLVYTGTLVPDALRGALAAGAAGLVSKVSAPTALVEAIRVVVAGDLYIDPRLEPLVADRAGDRPILSGREREVLSLIARGGSIDEIAQSLFLSPETVRTHVRNARTKLGARNRTEAVVTALREAQIGLDETG